jgi:hypothetical protein
MIDEWDVEPPWIADLPSSYAAYFRERPHADGAPRWAICGSGHIQSAIFAALLRALESTPDRNGHVRRAA